MQLGGVRRDLPYVPEADEPVFVVAATHVAATGDLDPGWFGHPGTTVIYPLALGIHVWHALAHGGRLLRPDGNLVVAYETIAPELYLLGRFLSVAYAVMCVPLAYLVGSRALGRRQAMVGAAFASVLPVAVWHAQIVRSDAAGTFFALLALWRCLIVLEEPRARNQGLAGAAIGLAIATRYFMVTLVPVLLLVDAFVWRRARSARVAELAGQQVAGQSFGPPVAAGRSSGQREAAGRSSGQTEERLVAGALLGLAAVPLTFALVSPYVILAAGTVIADLRYEARSVHLGSDSLSPLGNLWWYLSTALPHALTPPLAALAVVGSLRAFLRRNIEALLLLAFVAVLLLAISLSALHWERWLIQILPLGALFAADGLVASADAADRRLGPRATAKGWLIVAVAAIVALPAVTEVVASDVRQSRESTRQQASRWLLDNVPAESKVGIEWWTAPLLRDDFHGFAEVRTGVARPGPTAFEVMEYWRLSEAGSLDDLRGAGFDYLVVSGSWYGPVLAYSPDSSAADFYRDLMGTEPPEAEFAPDRLRGGPAIRIYKLSDE
ncbi:MAG: glycosyltransferase family 39 protein [Anaerolineae bacterium]